jgi:ribosome maturation factor RimP
MKIDPALHDRLTTLIASMGYEFLGCDLTPQGRQMIFRIYIDRQEADKSVTLDDCSRVSHQVSAMLDVEDPFQSRYALEISSPGIDRPLFELKHFQRFVGSEVKIRLYAPINQRRQYKGVVQRVVGEDIYLLVDGLEKEAVIPFSAIEKANVIGDIKF